MKFEHVFFVIFGLVAANLLFKLIKNRGLAGAMFGAPTLRLLSEVELEPHGMVKRRLKVHLLEPHDPATGPHVGIEVLFSTVASWEVKPIALTRAEAQRLAETLSLAARESVDLDRPHG